MTSKGMMLDLLRAISENGSPDDALDVEQRVRFGVLRGLALSAASPTRRPASVKATHEGVVRSPSALARTCASPSFHTETQE